MRIADPEDTTQDACLKDTIVVAGEMGITTVCTMSGLPAGNATDTMPNWVVSSWPPETQAILGHVYQQNVELRNQLRGQAAATAS